METKNRTIDSKCFHLAEVEPKASALKALRTALDAVVIELQPDYSVLTAKETCPSMKILVKRDSFNKCLESSRDDLVSGKAQLRAFGVSWRTEDHACKFIASVKRFMICDIPVPMKNETLGERRQAEELSRNLSCIDNPLYMIANIDDCKFKINCDLAGKKI